MLDGKKIVILACAEMDDCIVEVREIIRAMKNVNARVRLVGAHTAGNTSPEGDALRIDTKVDELDPADVDACIICHDCPVNDEQYRECYAFLHQLREAGVLIAAIGTGLRTLVRAGILDGDVAGRLVKSKAILRVPEAGLIIAPRATGIMEFIKEIISAVLARVVS